MATSRIGAVLKDLGITDYDFEGVYLYNQYKDSKPLSEFFSALNQYISEMLVEFFTDFKANINLRYNAEANSGQDVVKDSYLYYYLANYFGIFASMPYIQKGKGYKNIYDSGYIRYDTIDPTSQADNPHTYLYDDEIDQDSVAGAYTDYNLLAAITSWTLDRSWRVVSLPALADLLQRVYSSFYKENLDLNEVKFIPKDDYLYISLPNDPIWLFLQQIAQQNIFYLNLPFNGEVQFKIQAEYYLTMPEQVIYYPNTKGEFFSFTDLDTNLNEKNYLYAEFYEDEAMTIPKDISELFTINWDTGQLVDISPDDDDKTDQFPIYAKLTTKKLDDTKFIITENFVINYQGATEIATPAIDFKETI